MPFKSRRQQKWMYANKPQMAKAWTREARRKHVAVVQPKKTKKK